VRVASAPWPQHSPAPPACRSSSQHQRGGCRRYQGGSEAVRPEGVENEIVQTNEAIAASSDKTAGSIEKTEQRLGNYSTAAERLRPHAGSALQSDGRLL
jgi:hypothetical protein